MHGSGLTHIVWSLHETFLTAKGYSVLSVDLPGHGNSEGPAVKSIEDLAEWIKNTLDFDQLILEFYNGKDPRSGWVHVSYKDSQNNRKQVLTINKQGTFQGLI